MGLKQRLRRALALTEESRVTLTCRRCSYQVAVHQDVSLALLAEAFDEAPGCDLDAALGHDCVEVGAGWRFEGDSLAALAAVFEESVEHARLAEAEKEKPDDT